MVTNSFFTKVKNNNRNANYTPEVCEDPKTCTKLKDSVERRKLEEIDLHTEESNERRFEQKVDDRIKLLVFEDSSLQTIIFYSPKNVKTMALKPRCLEQLYHIVK